MTITLSTLSMVDYEGIATSGIALLAMTHTHISIHNDVILNVVKNLSESADVRPLCYPVDASLSLSMTEDCEDVDAEWVGLGRAG